MKLVLRKRKVIIDGHKKTIKVIALGNQKYQLKIGFKVIDTIMSYENARNWIDNYPSSSSSKESFRWFDSFPSS